jgi:hypothetical protein
LVAARLDAIQEVREFGLQVGRVVGRRHTVDAGSTILAGEPVGLFHPFQVDDVVQRGQRHSSLRSCQRSYPLSFRGQVCEAQSPLPCFPPTVLVPWRLPSLGRVPASPVPRGRQYYEGATTSRPRIPGHLFGSLPGTTRFPQGSCSPLQRSRVGGGPARARAHVQPAAQVPACSRVDVSRISQVPRRSVLCLCPAPRPRPNRRSLATGGLVGAAPARMTAKASA